MKTAACSNCRFYRPKPRREDDVFGACHREAPSTMHPSPSLFTAWPTVKPDDWCGEHRARGAIDDFKYQVVLREALVPFLRIAQACRDECAREGEDPDDKAFLLDIADEDGNGLGLTAAQFIALADAVPEV